MSDSATTDIAYLIREAVHMEPGSGEHTTGWFVANAGEYELLTDLRDSGAPVTAGNPDLPMRIVSVEFEDNRGFDYQFVQARVTLSAGLI